MSPLAIGQESYYEEDAWYDVSEWFDWNGYNPTDEAWWRWDNETHQAAAGTDYDFDDNSYHQDVRAEYFDEDRQHDRVDSKDSTAETDSAAARSTSDSDWLYAYHDLGYTSYVDWDDDGSFDTRYAYYDFNDDDDYDAYLVSSDNDGDGVYETNRYYSFNDLGQQRRGQQNEATQAARRVTRSGEIRQIRRTEVNDHVRYLAKVQGDNDRLYWFDLGSADAVEPTPLRIGDRISATGALTKAGDNLLLIASRYTMDGRATTARRAMRVVSGEIANTKQVQVGDRQILLAIVKGEDDTQMAVDLGAASGLPWRLEAGDRLSATGAPIQVGDKRLLLAHSVRSDGRTALIDRRQEQSQNRQQREPRDQQRSTTGAQEEEQSVDTWQRGVRSSSSTAAIGQAEVEGSIASLRTAMAGGLRRRMAQLQPEGMRDGDGQLIWVDLGPADQLGLDLQEGDTLRAQGIRSIASGQPILAARRVWQQGQSHAIWDVSDIQPAGRLSTKVIGEVVRTKKADVGGQERQMAMIQTDDSRRVWVDLGPARDARALDLQEGTRLSVRGLPLNITDQRLLLAFDASSGGQSVEIQR